MSLEYWKGSMNWPLDVHWKCVTCGTGPFMLAGLMANSNLTWGLPHALCRCDTCHTHYRMRDEDGEMTPTPICQLKPEFRESAQILWERDSIPLNEITDEAWDSVMATE